MKSFCEHYISENAEPLRSSNGLSFGLNIKDSLYRSYKELVERQVVLEYWGKKTPCRRIGITQKYNLLSFFYKLKLDIQFRFLFLPNNYGFKVVVCNLYNDREPPYNIFGYGSDENLDLACEKAFLEAWRFYWNFLKRKKTSKSKSVINGSEHHFDFYCDNKIDPYEVFVEDGESLRIEENINFKIDKTALYDLRKEGFRGISVCVTRNDFYPFQIGPLRSNFLKRGIGEIHPIA